MQDKNKILLYLCQVAQLEKIQSQTTVALTRTSTNVVVYYKICILSDSQSSSSFYTTYLNFYHYDLISKMLRYIFRTKEVSQNKC